MTTHAKRIIEPQEREFHTEQVVTIAFGHLTHDVYTAFIAPLLPLIIEKLSLSLTMAGTLTAIMQIPSVLNPFIGYLADRISLRYFVILAPAASATLMSLMGLAPNTISLALILFLTGVSSAAFHSPAPAMIGRISGDQIGKGMSFFMAAGELARSLGPLFAVWAASTWTLEGYYPVMILGWGASLLLFWRLHEISGRTEKRGDWRALTKMIRSFFLPLLFIVLARIFLQVCLGTYLPTLMTMEGSTLWIAGVSLAILEAAGVVGALTSGLGCVHNLIPPNMGLSKHTGMAVDPNLNLTGFHRTLHWPCAIGPGSRPIPQQPGGCQWSLHYDVISTPLIGIAAGWRCWRCLRTTICFFRECLDRFNIHPSDLYPTQTKKISAV
jgi:MFS family permease